MPGVGPLAQDDTFEMRVSSSRRTATFNVLPNDMRGTPLANVTSYGGGSLGGDVHSIDAGVTVSAVGVDVRLDANGTLTVTAPLADLTIDFRYEIVNDAGTSEALVRLVISRQTTPI